MTEQQPPAKRVALQARRRRAERGALRKGGDHPLGAHSPDFRRKLTVQEADGGTSCQVEGRALSGRAVLDDLMQLFYPGVLLPASCLVVKHSVLRAARGRRVWSEFSGRKSFWEFTSVRNHAIYLET